MANTSVTLPRETVEFLPLNVNDGSTAVTTFQTAVLPYKSRPQPSDWVSAVTIGSEHGFMVQGLTPGMYGVWVRVTSTPETIVISPTDLGGPGYITIT